MVWLVAIITLVALLKKIIKQERKPGFQLEYYKVDQLKGSQACFFYSHFFPHSFNYRPPEITFSCTLQILIFIFV